MAQMSFVLVFYQTLLSKSVYHGSHVLFIGVLSNPVVTVCISWLTCPFSWCCIKPCCQSLYTMAHMFFLGVLSTHVVTVHPAPALALLPPRVVCIPADLPDGGQRMASHRSPGHVI